MLDAVDPHATLSKRMLDAVDPGAGFDSFLLLNCFERGSELPHHMLHCHNGISYNEKQQQQQHIPHTAYHTTYHIRNKSKTKQKRDVVVVVLVDNRHKLF